MKKMLSIIATVAGAAYLAAGLAMLFGFQDSIKVAMGYGDSIELINVYPIQNVMELVLVGIPCVALGILSMSEGFESRRSLHLLMVVYSCVMLTIGGLLGNVGAFLNNIFVSRLEGASGLVNMSIVSGVFRWISFLANLSLVLLLLRGAFSLGENSKKQQLP